MALIQLTKGHETIVDDELFEELNSYNWYASGNDGRPARRLKVGPRKLIYLYHQVLHVLPWVISQVNMVVDHINHNPLDNRKVNLRLITHMNNMRNSIVYGNAKGICFDNTNQRYKAYLDRADLPRLNIGTYKTEEEALQALKNAKSEAGLEDN